MFDTNRSASIEARWADNTYRLNEAGSTLKIYFKTRVYGNGGRIQDFLWEGAPNHPVFFTKQCLKTHYTINQGRIQDFLGVGELAPTLYFLTTLPENLL